MGAAPHHGMAGVLEHRFRSRAQETIARAVSSHSVQACIWPRKRARFLPSDSSPVTLTTAQPFSSRTKCLPQAPQICSGSWATWQVQDPWGPSH